MSDDEMEIEPKPEAGQPLFETMGPDTGRLRDTGRDRTIRGLDPNSLCCAPGAVLSSGAQYMSLRTGNYCFRNSSMTGTVTGGLGMGRRSMSVPPRCAPPATFCFSGGSLNITSLASFRS
jgi:hypothetical protein